MNTIKLDKNFVDNCDRLMKDLPKPTTQTEEIVWHKYPEEKPRIGGKCYLVSVWWHHCEIELFKDGKFCHISDSSVKSWAELPKGWIEK